MRKMAYTILVALFIVWTIAGAWHSREPLPLAPNSPSTVVTTGGASAATPVVSAVLGASISALVSWIVYRRVLQERTARELLLEALSVQALEEAWILEGRDEQSFSQKISQNRNLKEGPSADELWLRRVEVRAILDEAEWNSPSKEPYGFVGTRRAWIVRDEVQKNRIVILGPTQRHYPALISSKGREELCGWVERVQNAYRGPFWIRALHEDGLEMLRPLLVAVAQEDRIEMLRDGLTSQAVNFLMTIKARWGAISIAGWASSA
jgi:hypothetical protein